MEVAQNIMIIVLALAYWSQLADHSKKMEGLLFTQLKLLTFLEKKNIIKIDSFVRLKKEDIDKFVEKKIKEQKIRDLEHEINDNK